MNNQITDITERLRAVSDTPRLDARFLAEDASCEEELESFIKRRLNGEPVAKIIGHKGFWKKEFKTTKDTLDPRPDSETLIDAVLKVFPDKNAPYKILDIGTGTGCRLLSLLDEYPSSVGTGIDISEKTLSVAKENAGTSNRVFLIQRDFTSPLWTQDLGTFDIIISNPPYIPTDELKTLSKETLHDPILALDGGCDGLLPYRIFSEKLPFLCHKKTQIFFEIGKDQETDVQNLMAKNFTFKQAFKDFSGIIRILHFSV
ncbi:MAG: peptide chain release factor N(5)-glutamine methyltransferase [Alphaproteobacteria bacterium]|nr:peptide chain release factor N(5)-glutamine methyltransferase [Alphaproteobacteria bacterium]